MTTQTRRRLPRGLIVRKATVCGGSPTITGTRIRVSDIVRNRRLGHDTARIRRAIPHLGNDQIEAALAYYNKHRREIDDEIEREEALGGQGE